MKYWLIIRIFKVLVTQTGLNLRTELKQCALQVDFTQNYLRTRFVWKRARSNGIRRQYPYILDTFNHLNGPN